MNHQKLYTVKEAGKLLRASDQLIRRLAKGGKLESIHVGNRIMITRPGILKYLKLSKKQFREIFDNGGE